MADTRMRVFIPIMMTRKDHAFGWTEYGHFRDYYLSLDNKKAAKT